MRSTPWRMWGKQNDAGGKVKLCAATEKASADPTGSQGAGMTPSNCLKLRQRLGRL